MRRAKSDRRRAESRWLKFGLTVHKQIYNAAKHAVTKLVHKAKSVFLRDEISNCDTAKTLFNVCGRLTGRSKMSPLPTLYPTSQQPKLFCDYFLRKVAQIRSELDSVPPSPATFPDTTCDHVFPTFQPVSEDEVRSIVLKSNPTTCALDPLPTSLLLECIDTVLPSLTQIINDSLTSGIFPASFKQALVKPLLKKPSLDVNNLSNYRPVSNLSFFSKVLEKVILKQLLAYLNSHSLISQSQSAYRPFHSTETALLKVTTDVLMSLDEGNMSILTLLDLSAAFDTIDHTTLLSRLSKLYGVSGSALAWFESYLRDRTQTVLVDGQTSDAAVLSFGVPQGSVLGPILFILYTKPLSSLIQSHSVSNQSFADDTQLYNSTSPQHALSTLDTLESCISDVKSWMTENKLKLNDDKTEALLLKKRTANKPPCLPDSVLVGNSHIPFSTSARNLGFYIASDMTLDKHVSNICRVAYYELRKISAIRQHLSSQTANTLVCAFVLSRLDYCNSLLAGCPKHLTNKLQKLQNSAARLVLQARKHDHAKPLLRTLHWLPIQARIEYKLSSLCFHFFSGTAPSYLSDILTPYTPGRQLRSSTDSRTLRPPMIKTKTYGERTFSYSASHQWNSLPLTLRHSQSMHSFKRQLKTHLFQKHLG